MIQHSYDIFDTCLTRLCGDPKNIFILMARKIFGKSCSDTQANDFRYMRVRAEIEATDAYKEKTSLSDIYNQLDFYHFTSMTTAQLIELECSTEELNLRPIKKSLNEIKQIHDGGERIIYISDMYLPSAFLIKILKKFGFWDVNDALYVSCECGCTKISGSLYDYVEKKEKLNRRQWVHYGDNKRSDIAVLRNRGIRTELVSTNYTKIQKLYHSLDLSTTTHFGQILSGILRSIYHENEYNATNLFAVDLIAPIYVPFVYNVMRDATLRGIKKLYFLARDGYIFYRIAEIFKPKFPDVEIHYLCVSRKSLYLPSIREVNKTTLSSLIIDTKYSNIREHIDNLQIDFGDEFYKLVESGKSPVEVILNTPKYIKCVEDRIKEQRDLVVKYFIQEGLASNMHDVAIVDLRGTRRCQKSISSILEMSGFCRVYGYYLEAVHNRIYPDIKDDYCAYMFGDNIAQTPIYNGLQNVKDILEHYFSLTPFQRTSGYQEFGSIVTPIFDKDNLDTALNESLMDTNVKICQSFAEKLLLLGFEDRSNDILNIGFVGLASFMRKPENVYLEALINIKASQTSYKSKSVISKITPSSIINHNISWYEGSIKYTFGNIGLYVYKLSLPVIKNIYKWMR